MHLSFDIPVVVVLALNKTVMWFRKHQEDVIHLRRSSREYHQEMIFISAIVKGSRWIVVFQEKYIFPGC